MPILQNSNTLPEVLKRTILKASCEDRLKVGLNACIDHLNSCDPVKILSVILTDNTNDLFSQTILETYCYEQSIPFMKTDLKMLRRIVKCIQCEVDKNCDPTCIIIMKAQNNLINSDEVELVKAIHQSELNNETLVLLNQQALTPTSPTSPMQWPQATRVT